MSKSPPIQMPEYKGWESVVLRILKWLAIIGVILFILATVLSRLGGNSPILRESIEEFLTDTTPYTARIGTLNSMRFFPNIAIDVADVQLRAGDDGTGETMIRVGAARLVMPFFDALFRPGHFKDLHIENLRAAPGSILEKSMEISAMNVREQDGGAALIVEGVIGNAPLHAKFGLQTKGKPGRHTYVIGRKRDFEISLADLTARGIIQNTVMDGYKFENIILFNKQKEVLRGHIDMDRIDSGKLEFNGQIRLEPGKTRIDPDITLDWTGETPLISGKLTSNELILSDVTGDSPVQSAIDAFDKIVGNQSAALDLNGLVLDLNLDVQKLKSGMVELGHVKTPLTLENGDLHMGPMEGKIVGGTLSGQVDLPASKSPAKLTQKIKIKGFDYTALQKQLSSDESVIEGHGDILIDLSSESTTMEGLIEGLSGKIGFVGGQGKMRAGLLDLWGGGLLNALLPSFEKDSDLNMNCIVVNLDVKDLKGQSDAVFVDTKRVTLHGEGTYDFQKDHLEMVLEPKPKEIAIGDIGGAVNVSGPLSDLKTTPNVFDLGKRVGGLLLGAVNPAFYAVTLADFGLAEDHPCKAFVIEKEVLSEPQKPEAETVPEGETAPEDEEQKEPPNATEEKPQDAEETKSQGSQ